MREDVANVFFAVQERSKRYMVLIVEQSDGVLSEYGSGRYYRYRSSSTCHGTGTVIPSATHKRYVPVPVHLQQP